MPRRNKRWQPPHPDPVKTLTIKSKPSTTSTAEMFQCQWRDCHRFSFLVNTEIRLCTVHHRMLDEYFRGLTQSEERTQATADAINQAIAARIEAGEPLERGEQPPGWVYYVKSDGLIKIGYSKAPEQRLRTYSPTSVILGLRPGTPKLERSLHSLFCGDLARGREWFHPSDRLLAHIAEIVAQHGEPPAWCNDRFRDASTYTTKSPIIGGKHWRGTKKTAA